MNILYRLKFRSVVGEMTLLSTEKGICFVRLPGVKSDKVDCFVERYFPEAVIRQGGKINKEASRQLQAYFRGKLRKFTVKTDLRSRPFHRRVLGRVKNIPYGKTKTYGEIAAKMGSARASRAVGGANASNPLPIIIPCHRVLAQNGLGGYAGTSKRSLNLKKWLLRLEGVDLTKYV